MKKVTYSAHIGQENDLFKPTKISSSFPIAAYKTVEDKYKIDYQLDERLNQADIPVEVSGIEHAISKTKVYANSANILATDRPGYFFKTPKIHPVVYIDGALYQETDANFIYLKTDAKITINYLNPDLTPLLTSTVNPVPMFIFEGRKDLQNIINLDNRTYSIGKSKKELVITYSKPNVQISSENRSVLDIKIFNQDDYPLVEYAPFLIQMNFNGNIYEYDYSRVKTTIKKNGSAETYFFENIFRLFDYHLNDLVAFRQNKYPSFNAFIGFKPTTTNSTKNPRNLIHVVRVNGEFIYQDESPIDDSILFSATLAKKNIVEKEWYIENTRPALIEGYQLNKDLIGKITNQIYKESLPQAYYVANKPKNISFQNIIGQSVKTLNPFIDIQGSQIDDNYFQFDLSSIGTLFDVSNQEVVDDLIFDYSVPSALVDRLNSWKKFIDKNYFYSGFLSDFYLFGSVDNNEYNWIDRYNYSLSIDSNISKLTVRVNTDILQQFTSIKIGFFNEKLTLLSGHSIDLWKNI